MQHFMSACLQYAVALPANCFAGCGMQVMSPLASLPKSLVRLLAREAGLPNWDYAASPCLRSRLEIGVPACSDNLHRVELAEGFVRRTLVLLPQEEMRVRSMVAGDAVVELSASRIGSLTSNLVDEVGKQLEAMGFNTVRFREFRSGSVASAKQSNKM